MKPVDAPGFIEFITELIISNKIINLSVREKKDFLEPKLPDFHPYWHCHER